MSFANLILGYFYADLHSDPYLYENAPLPVSLPLGGGGRGGGDFHPSL